METRHVPLKSYEEECMDAPPFSYPSDGCTQGGCMKFCSHPLALAPVAEYMQARQSKTKACHRHRHGKTAALALFACFRHFRR